ncbi:MAG: FACT complex subunit [Watsoniomyces obsoletus]|nr:MAG: FACT complex subunit [Watsoniomyces obsoletus]
MAPQLAPAGSSTYASGTLNVGDGTWDAGRNTFLLPNLVGFNFATTRYNGMGNRFASLPQYHNLIRAHGIIAAIVFLGIVPTAILTARFYHGRPGWSIRVHIWLQILTVLLTTVIFILGWFAVGPNRSLSNPHHSIGLAIYVLVLFQTLGGWFVHGREKGKTRLRLPLKLMIHQWFGRGIALLGLAQIPLGLALYGSPAWLFVVYTLVAFTLLLIYFVLSYRDGKYEYAGHGHGHGHSRGRGSSVSSTTGEVVDDDRRHSRRPSAGALGAAGLAGAALAALHRMRRRSRSPRDGHRGGENRSRRGSRVDVVGSRPPSESYISEKYPRDGRDRGGTWQDRLLKIGALAGGAALIKNMLSGGGGRKRGYDDHDSYRDGEASSVDGSEGYTNDSPSRVSRLEEGQGGGSGPPRTPTRDYRHHPLPRDSPGGSSITRTSLDSPTRPSQPRHDDRHKSHKARDGVATLGALGVLRAALKSRRDRKEQRRIEELRKREMEDERLARRGSQKRYTGDGFPRRGGRRNSLPESTDNYSSVVNGGGGRNHHHQQGSSSRRYDPPPGGNGGPPVTTGGVVYDNNIANATAPLPMPEMPITGQHHHEDSGSEAYLSPGGRQHRRHHSSGLRNTVTTTTTGTSGGLVPPVTSAGAGGVGVTSSSNLLPPPNPIPAATPSATSPPISVKVKYHGDEGRHVTLRRLPEEEALTEREQRRRDRHSRRRESLASSAGPVDRDRRRRRGTSGGGGRRRRDSESEISEGEEKWRRVEELERAQAEQSMRLQQGQTLGGTSAGPSIPMPNAGQVANMTARNQTLTGGVPPPPIPVPGGISTTATGGLPPPPTIPAATGGYSYGYGSGHGNSHGQQQGEMSSPMSMTTDPSMSGTAGTFSPAGGGNGSGGDYATRRQRRRAERARQGGSSLNAAAASASGGPGAGGGNTSGGGGRGGTVEFD